MLYLEEKHPELFMMHVGRILTFCLIATMFSCSSEEQEKQITELKSENNSLRTQLANRDSVMNTIIGAYGAIDSNLKKVETKKVRISELAKKRRLSAAEKEEIKAEMDSINLLLQENKMKVTDLEMSFSGNEGSGVEMSIMLKGLEEKNDVQDDKIVDMKHDLAQISKDFSDLFENYVYTEAKNMEIKEKLSSTAEELQAAKEKLFSAYYVVGTSDELKEKGIVYKGGWFDSKSVNEDFDKTQFKKIDIGEFQEIILDTKKAQIMTTHPSESYEMVGMKKQVNKLVIRQPELFWSVSKFLIIEVEH